MTALEVFQLLIMLAGLYYLARIRWRIRKLEMSIRSVWSQQQTYTEWRQKWDSTLKKYLQEKDKPQ